MDQSGPKYFSWGTRPKLAEMTNPLRLRAFSGSGRRGSNPRDLACEAKPAFEKPLVTWSTHGPHFPERETGSLLEVGDGGVNKVDVATSYTDGKTRIKSFKSVSIKRALPEEGAR